MATNMRGINKVILLGFVGNDPDLKTFNNGNYIVQLSLATTETWKERNANERKEFTEWHRLVFHKPLADVVQKYVTKGSKLYIEGSLKTRQWSNQTGTTKYTTEIHVQNMQMLDGLPKPQISAVVKQNVKMSPPSKNTMIPTDVNDTRIIEDDDIFPYVTVLKYHN